jgi:hypothetical protein
MWNKNFTQKKEVIKTTKDQLLELITSPWMLDVALLICCLVEKNVRSPLKLDSILIFVIFINN